MTTKTAAIENKAPAIAAELQALARRGVVPYGTGAELGAKYGVTRERVRQLIQAGGLRVGARPSSTRPCRGCKRPTRASRGYCSGCIARRSKQVRMVALTCAGCGERFEREARKVRANERQATRRGQPGQVFCSSACAGRAYYGKD